MRKFLLLTILSLCSLHSYSQDDEYVTIDEAFPETETVSELATMTPEYHVYKQRGVKLLVGGLVSTAIGGGMIYYSHRYMKGHSKQEAVRNGGIVLAGIGTGITISAIIPLTRARKIKRGKH